MAFAQFGKGRHRAALNFGDCFSYALAKWLGQPHQFRSELMIANNEGLTSTYNRFHDPAETSPAHLQLRELHTSMDQAVTFRKVVTPWLPFRRP